jgi:hypothetical protein
VIVTPKGVFLFHLFASGGSIRSLDCSLMIAKEPLHILSISIASPSQAADSASEHLVEQKEDRGTLSKWGNGSSSELPNYCDRSRCVGVRCKTADGPCYSGRERGPYHPAQACRGSSPEPTTGGQQRCICCVGRRTGEFGIGLAVIVPDNWPC